MVLLLAYAEICKREFPNVNYTKKVSINKQNLAVSEVSRGPYCDSNVSSGTETYAANLVFMW